MRVILSLIAILVCLSSSIYGQKIKIKTINENNVEGFLEEFLGDGVILKSVQTNIVRNNHSLGTFKEKRGKTGIESGIILSTGSVKDIVGANSSDSYTDGSVVVMDPSKPREDNRHYFVAGDSDLAALLKGKTRTYDACVIEMEIIPMANSIAFNYVFASDEYDEFVGSQFNDVFGLFISGPGINGLVNLATLPGTSIPISINNVNRGNESRSYKAQNSSFYVPNEGQYNLEYDGFTKLMSIRQKVVPFETYRIKIAIADVGDYALDSGVMLEHKSLISFHEDYEVNFETADDQLTEDAKLILDKLLTIYEERGYKKVMLTGHTDGVGDVAYNQNLSEQRVSAVEEYMIAAGIDEDLFVNTSKGEMSPIASNGTAAGQGVNRRVEIKFLGDEVEYMEKQEKELADMELTPSMEKIYPNPANASTNFEYSIPPGFSSASIEVYQGDGKKVTSVELNIAGPGTTTLSTASLKPGLYHASLEIDGERVNTLKFTVKH